MSSPPARIFSALVAAAALVVAIPASLQAQSIAITGATVHPVSAPPISDATVIVRDGRIVAVGADLEVPAGARRFDARGMVVTPGLFDVVSRLGLLEVSSLSDTRDYSLSAEDPVRAAFDVVDGLNPRSVLIPVNRLGGITAAVSAPSGGLVAGQAAVIRLAGETLDELLVRPRAAMMASFDAGDAGGARGAVSLRLREVLDDARFWRDNRASFDRGASRTLSASRLDLEALQPVLAGEMPIVVTANRASDIEAVMRIADEYGLHLVIAGGTEAWMVRDRLAADGVPVLVVPLTNAPSSFASLGARFDNAALLAEAGVPLLITSGETHRASDLTWQVGNSIKHGLDSGAALRAVTLEPARVFGVAADLGSLEPGKLADLVIWSGDPFELSSRPVEVMIGGVFVPQESRQRQLFERYRDASNLRSPAYRR